MTTKEVRELWDAHCLLNYGGMGVLHGVCEDGNLEDIILDRQIEEMESALKVLRALKELRYPSRWKVYQQFSQEYDIARYNPAIAELEREAERIKETP